MDDDFGFTTILNSWTPSVSEQLISGLTDGIYYFRVRAQDNDLAWSAWSNIENITIDLPNIPPPAPTLYDPGDVDDDGSFMLNWSTVTDSDGGIIGYYIQISNTSGFSYVLATTFQVAPPVPIQSLPSGLNRYPQKSPRQLSQNHIF